MEYDTPSLTLTTPTKTTADAHRRKGCPFLLTPLTLVKGTPPDSHQHHHAKPAAAAAAASANGDKKEEEGGGGLSPLLTVEAAAAARVRFDAGCLCVGIIIMKRVVHTRTSTR